MTFFFYLSKLILDGYDKHKKTTGHHLYFHFTERGCQIHPQNMNDYFMVTFLMTDLNLNQYDKII